MISERPSLLVYLADDIPSLLLIYSAKPAGLAKSHVTRRRMTKLLKEKSTMAC